MEYPQQPQQVQQQQYHARPSGDPPVSSGHAHAPYGSSNNSHPTNQKQPVNSAFQSPITRGETGLTLVEQDKEFEDGRVINPEAVKKIREDWVYTQMTTREKEFTQYKNLRIFLGTWNVNAKFNNEPLDPFLCSNWNSDGSNAPDIIAIGLQEMVDLNAVNVAVENKSAQKSQTWRDCISRTLNHKRNSGNDPSRAYVELHHKYLVGLMLVIFVKAHHKPRCQIVQSDSVGVGVMGMMGNKGGVSVRLQFYDSTICFVNSHLAAHRENVAGRNADFHNVYSKLAYNIGNNETIGVANHDIVFWMGDLNYRIKEDIATEEVLALCQRNELNMLKKNDQLNHERMKGNAFKNFFEGELNFLPTYKYQPGTDLYEQRPDKKLRAPAWCDRVLWMVQESNYLKQVSYRRSELNISDHKPVMAEFLATIKDIIPSELEKVKNSVNARLDQYENKSLPMIGLDRTELDFGEVRYGRRITLPIKVTNTGNVVAHFRLVPKLDESKYCKPWLAVLPTYGMLIPGEKETTINFTVEVNNDIASALNSGKDVLDDIIILRLENGRDYYITVRGRYGRSCFGMSLDELVMYNDPIRTVPLDPVKRIEKYGSDQTAVLCVPKELWRIVDAIYEKGLHERELFGISGYIEETQHIRECLDTSKPFGNFRVHSMADVLVSFLSSLSSTVVPSTLLPTLEVDAQNVQGYARTFLEGLPPIHYNVFVYIISFFRECLLFQQSNQLTTAKVARLCVTCLVTGNQMDESKQAQQRRHGISLLMIHFLESSSI